MTIYYNILIVFLGGCLGMVMHFAFKFASLRKVMRKSGSDLTVAKYVEEEWPVGITVILTILFVCFILREVTNRYPVVLQVIRFFSVAAGWFGNRIVQKVMGSAEGKVMDFIDLKTNIADKYINGTNVTEEDISNLQKAENNATK